MMVVLIEAQWRGAWFSCARWKISARRMGARWRNASAVVGKDRRRQGVELRGGNRRRGWGSILHGQRTISMHEARWSYSFLSTQNTYLHFGLCTGVSLLVFHVRLYLCPTRASLSLSLSLFLSVSVLSLRGAPLFLLHVSLPVRRSRFLGRTFAISLKILYPSFSLLLAFCVVTSSSVALPSTLAR